MINPILHTNNKITSHPLDNIETRDGDVENYVDEIMSFLLSTSYCPTWKFKHICMKTYEAKSNSSVE